MKHTVLTESSRVLFMSEIFSLVFSIPQKQNEKNVGNKTKSNVSSLQVPRIS